MDAAPGESASEKSALMLPTPPLLLVVPRPVKATLCCEFEPLVVTVIDPERDPAAVGAKLIEMTQFAPGARLVQPVVAWKSPVMLVALMVSCPVPVLLNVTV